METAIYICYVTLTLGEALLPNLHYPTLTDEFIADVGKGNAIIPKHN